jgi:FkbM family methyltransferase
MPGERLASAISRALDAGRELLGVIKCPELSPSGKRSLVIAKARYHARILRHDTVVDCRTARIRFGRESFPFDWYVFYEIFIDRVYERVHFPRATVLDLGAHKGYFAAFALIRGAREVVSYEPEATNFRRLAAAAAEVPGWTVHPEAVAGEAGVRSLSIRDAWSHTLIRHRDGADVATVSATSLESVLKASKLGPRQVLKIDIEGAECEALAGTPSDVLARVDELVIETHEDAPCQAAHIITLAGAAGLSRIDGKPGASASRHRGAPVLHFRGSGQR